MKTISKRLDPILEPHGALGRAFTGACAVALLVLGGACTTAGVNKSGAAGAGPAKNAGSAHAAGTVNSPGTINNAGTVNNPGTVSNTGTANGTGTVRSTGTATSTGTPIKAATDRSKPGAASADARIYAQAPTGSDAVSGDATARIEPDSMRMTSRMQGRASIIDIFSPDPVGGVQLSAPQGGWPQTVQLRFHKMAAMQGFSARTKVAALRCDAATAEAKDAPHLCMLGDKPVDAIKRNADGFEVELPGALLSAEDASMEVRWVDRYR